jgi:hypothetical protein
VWHTLPELLIRPTNWQTNHDGLLTIHHIAVPVNRCVSPQVDKIFGPGNQYVTAAKMLLTNSEAMISIDMPAGPSEVLVIAGGDWQGVAALAMVTAAAATETAAAACQCLLCCYRTRRAQRGARHCRWAGRVMCNLHDSRKLGGGGGGGGGAVPPQQ